MLRSRQGQGDPVPPRFAGVPFYGDREGLRALNRRIDALAFQAEQTRPKRWPRGNGRARRTILKRLGLEFPTGLTAGQALRWLETQDWNNFK